MLGFDNTIRILNEEADRIVHAALSTMVADPEVSGRMLHDAAVLSDAARILGNTKDKE
jgi:hypothetical protein